MVYQQFINYLGFLVYENIVLFLWILGMFKVEIDCKVCEIVEMLCLMFMLQCKLLELLGGQQQCCVLVCVLVKGVGFVLLDEFLVNFDYKLCEELCIEILCIFEVLGVIFVYVIIEFEEVLLLGGNIVMLWEGCVIQFGLMLQVYCQLVDVIMVWVFSDLLMNFIQICVQVGWLDLVQGVCVFGIVDGVYQVGFCVNYLLVEKFLVDVLEFCCQVVVIEIIGV